MDIIYTLIGRRADGSSPVVDLRPAAADDLTPGLGEAFLVEHLSCAEVEIWRDGTWLTTVFRPAPQLAAASDGLIAS